MFYQMLQLDCHYLTKHAQVFMKELGITYKHAVPQSIANCWQFWCCEVPEATFKTPSGDNALREDAVIEAITSAGYKVKE